MNKFLKIIVMFTFMFSLAFAQHYVTFKVNMGKQIALGNFNPNNVIYANVIGVVWANMNRQSIDDSVWVVTVTGLGTLGTTFPYRYVYNSHLGQVAEVGAWRQGVILGDTTVLETVYFDRNGYNLPNQPYCLIPFPGSQNISLSARLIWTADAIGTSTYHLQVAEDSNFTSLVLDYNGVLDNLYTFEQTPLSNNTLFYWRMSATNPVGTTPFCNPFWFTTIAMIPSPPTLVLPLDGAIDQSLTPTLTWNAVSGSSTYRLQVSINSGFTSLVYDDSTIVAASKTLPTALSYSTTYYWRVNAKNVAGTSAYSSSKTFTTIPAIPTSPTLATPSDGSIDQSVTPTLSWNAVSGAISYRLQVSTNSGFTSLVYNDSTLTTTSKTLPTALSNNTLYYWRVNAKNAGGTSGYSSIWSFTTIPAVPTAPTLATPVDGAIDQSLTPTLTWNAVSGATTYRLQVSTTSGFTSLVYSDSALTATSKTLPTALSNNTLYYWRVSAKNAGGTSGYSTTWAFTTVPAIPTAPTLATPVDGAIDQSLIPTLTWNAVSGATTYRLQVSTTSGFTSLVYNDSSLTTTSKILPTALSNNTLYYWRVNAKNAGGTSGYSTSRTFRTVPAVPSTPTLVSPLDGAIDQSLTPTLTWNAVSGASTYRLQVSTNSGFTSFVFNDSTLTTNTKTLPNELSFNTMYFWRVNSKNAGGTSGYSSQWSFVTRPNDPSIPNLLTPFNGSIDQSLTPTFTWNAVSGASSYRLQVSTNSGFTSLVYNDSTLTTTSKTLSSALSNSTTYYWRVNAKNSGGTGGYSSAWSFTTIPVAPSTPTLVSPLNGAGEQSLTPTVTWSAVSGASTYRLQVSTNSGFTSFVYNDSTLTTPSKTLPTALSNNTLYYWRVSAKNAGGTSGYSSVWSFTTIPAVSSTPTLISPENGAIEQSVTPSLTWNSVSGTSTYRLQVSTNSGFTSFVFDDSTLTTTSKTLQTALSNNTLYYWRVSAKNAGGTSGYSSVWSFTTIPAVPATPILLAPLNSAIDQSVTPSLTWNSVSGASKYRLQVSTNSGFTSFVYDDSTITETSKTLPAALANNTIYYWRVSAKNSGGTSGYSTSWTFTTITAIPTAPTLATPLDGAIDQSITPTLTWNSVSGAVDYRLQISTDSTFASTLFDESGLTGTNKNVGNLSYNKIYFWRVSARNSAGTSGWSQKFRFSTIKPTISLITPNGGENMAVGRTYQINWSSQFVQGVKLELSTNNGIGWISITSLGTGVQSYNWTIPTGTVSTSCKVRISDETDASINDISSTAFTIFEYPSVIEVSKQVSFSGTTENSYRMVGLPGNISIPVTSVITGTQKTDWQAYRDNGVISTNRAEYLIEHSASNPLSFTLGRGLWLLSKNVLAVSRQESSAAINDSSYALVPLQSNWNIITNPYNRVIQWSRILTANNITQNPLLYSFNGSWVNNTSAMTPYEGYLFFNFHGLATLKIPYDPNGSLAKGNFAPLPLKISDNKISLSLVQGSEVKSNLMAAIDAAASEDFDSTDYFAPPSSFEDVSIIIKNQNLTTAYKSLFAESRPMNGDGQIFDLQLKNVTGEELKFDFTGMYKFKEYEVYLFDARLKKYYNLKEKNNILSPAYVREGKFSLLIGKSSFIESEKAKNIVNEYTLLQNYPNPFNPKTVIMYSLKAHSNVVLTVYDITGSIVARLVDGSLSEGYHEAVFNADNLASGIYIYRLEVKNGNNMVYTSTKKMVVAK